MGKIIRNGIKYSGTTNSADKINYNNTLSGLEAETAQEAFDELNTKIKNGGNIEYLTQEEYDALPDTKLSNDVEYRITNANESVNAARDWAYDNSESGLEAETVQDAIDEVNDSVGALNNNLNTIQDIDITSTYELELTTIKKCGKVVHFYTLIHIPSTESDQAVLAKLDVKPLSTVIVSTNVPNVNNWIYINTDGEIVLRYKITERLSPLIYCTFIAQD